MLSRRLSWTAVENPIAQALQKRRAAGLPVLDLTATNPTQAGFAYDEAAVRAALAGPDVLRYEPAAKGLRAAREAVARSFAARGAVVDPEHIVLTASTSEAYSFLFKLLCDPGDEVVTPRPCYPLFDYLAGLEGVRTVPCALSWDGEWHLPARSLASALEAAPRAKAVLVVNPGNPTGAFLKRDERDEIARQCAARGCALVSDEVFEPFALRDDPRRVRTVAGFPDVLSFALGGLSKACGLPQLKLGYCAVSGPAQLVERAVDALSLIADTYLSVASPVQHGAAALLATGAAFQAQVRARLQANLDALRAARPEGARWDVLASEGGWSAILSVPRARSEDEHVLRLLDAGVLVHPGYFFDFPTEGHLVVSLLAQPGDVTAAAARMAAVLDL